MKRPLLLLLNLIPILLFAQQPVIFPDDFKTSALNGKEVTITNTLTLTNNYSYTYGTLTFSNGQLWTPTEKFEPGVDMFNQKNLENQKNQLTVKQGSFPIVGKPGEERYKTLGMMYADSQWELPANWKLEEGEERQSSMYGDFKDADICQPEQKEWNDKGYSWQTRFWLDDMYMITTIQAQAYRVTNDRKYIDRAAREMVLYLDSIQQPSGLFYHAPTAPFCWGRGNGWMAAGMSELLRMLPQDNPDRAEIMKGYLKMMEKLKDTQDENGMWKQVVDDISMWEETSGSAMFAYAMITGVKKGWLPAEEYGPVARNAWIALTKYVNEQGDVEAVCEGTMLGDNSEKAIRN